MYKAKFIGATRDRNPREAWKHTELWYEYRGHQYCVVKHNNGYMDKPLRVQHEEAQREIDEMIDNPKPVRESKYEGSAQEGFDLFWEYCETGEWTE